MTHENKELLLKDLCARMPYGVFVVDINENDEIISTAYNLYDMDIRFPFPKDCSMIKPYLRPMSTMTKEEKEEMRKIATLANAVVMSNKLSDFFNSRHIDYHGLIEKGLALEAPDDMYKLNNK